MRFRTGRSIVTVTAVALFVIGVSGVVRAAGFGKFLGTVQAEWLDHNRSMKLLKPFGYVDPHQIKWNAPAASIVDGASIPQMFWSIIGGPFDGPYRNASVLHDVECQVKLRPWRRVHRMFYEACRCGGVSETKALVMYWAVYHFGPRWGAAADTVALEAPETPHTLDYARLREIARTRRLLDPADMEQLTPERLRQLVPTVADSALRPIQKDFH